MATGRAQLELFPKKRRRRRRGVTLGRPRKAERAGFVPHVKRQVHDAEHPVHVSMKRVRLAPSLRTEMVSELIMAKLTQLKARGVRVLHFSIQHDHLHLMVEGESASDLSRKLQLLFSGVARAVNRLAGRRGKLFRDRHHRHALSSATGTRRALVYVLFNERKHSGSDGWFNASALDWLDRHSSAAWFDDWHPDARPPPEQVAAVRGTMACPVSTPTTRLARTEWKYAGGLLRFNELPRIES